MVPKICSFPNCGRPSRTRGFCSGHYHQHAKGRDLQPLGGTSLTAGMSPEERFWFRVDKSGDCWEWTGAREAHGYGAISIDRRKEAAHRLSYQMEYGPIPEGMDIDHICHNPPCVRPSHLQAVSRKANGENRSGAPMNSKSGVRGVTPHRNKWQAQTMHNGQAIYVGLFDTIAEAESAVIAKRNELHTNNLKDRQVA